VVLWHFPYFTFFFFFVFNSTEMQVSVPCSSLSMVVTVRCGHCTSLLSVNMMKTSFVPFHLLASLSHLEVIGYLSNSMFVSFVLLYWIQWPTYSSLTICIIYWIFNWKSMWLSLLFSSQKKVVQNKMLTRPWTATVHLWWLILIVRKRMSFQWVILWINVRNIHSYFNNKMSYWV